MYQGGGKHRKARGGWGVLVKIGEVNIHTIGLYVTQASIALLTSNARRMSTLVER